MSATEPLSPEAVLRNYFHAKDEDRPRLLAHVLSPEAELEVLNRATTLSFPCEAIAEVLVSGFGRVYENVTVHAKTRPP